MRSKWLGAFVGLFAALLPRSAAADRIVSSMGRYIQQAAVIAVADAKESGSPDVQAVLELREILKGGIGSSTSTIAIRWSCIFKDGVSIPPGSTRVAVLLAPRWQQADCPLLAAYRQPQEIAAVRELTPIYALASERSRLEALRALANDPNPLYRVQLFDDLRQMLEPANFPIVLDLFDALDIAGQRAVVQLLEAIGDLRGVPTLLKALTSSDPLLRASAEQTLSIHFRGAPGVDEALRHARRDVARQPETPYQAAARLWDSGHRQRGRLRFLAVAQDRSESDYVRMQSALMIASTLSRAERDTLQAAIRPLMARMVAKGNYLELLDAAKILRAVRSPRNHDLLTTLLDRKQADFVGQATPYLAAQAIRELGPRTRRRAAERLRARVVAAARAERTAGEPQPQLLALAWLGDPDQLAGIEDWTWSAFRPLLGVGQQRDEGLFLVHVLQNHSDLPPLALAWMAHRLGDLRETRAVTSLIQALSTSHADLAPVWRALAHIGGPMVESEAAKLLTHSSPEVRTAAIDILQSLQGPKMLPLLRRMIAKKDFGVKSNALLWMGQLGEPEDLKWLVPMADFWTGDRVNHYWAMLAVAEIQQRHGPRRPGGTPERPAPR
jgi:HEAT repeat protein